MRQLRATLYRLLCSPVNWLIFLIGAAFCLWASKSADLLNAGELARRISADPDNLARLRNVFRLQSTAPAEMYAEYFRTANLPLIYSLASGSTYTFNIFLCALLLGRDLHRLRLQRELVAFGRARTLAFRLLLIQLVSALFHIAVFWWGLGTWVDRSAFSPALLWGTLGQCVVITAANAAFIACVYTLFRSAVWGAVVSAAAEVAILRLSLSLPLTPARFLFSNFRSGDDVAALCARLGPYALWAAGYVLLFTALSFLLFSRKELR